MLGSLLRATCGRRAAGSGLPPTLARFVIVGGFGFLVYQASLFLLYDLPLARFLPDPDGAAIAFLPVAEPRLLVVTILAGELSIIAGFFGHEFWTFHHVAPAGGSRWARLLRFNLKAFVSSLLLLTFIVNALKTEFGVDHHLAAVVGTAVGFLWNWVWDSQVIWRRRQGHV